MTALLPSADERVSSAGFRKASNIFEGDISATSALDVIAKLSTSERREVSSVVCLNEVCLNKLCQIELLLN